MTVHYELSDGAIQRPTKVYRGVGVNIQASESDFEAEVRRGMFALF